MKFLVADYQPLWGVGGVLIGGKYTYTYRICTHRGGKKPDVTIAHILYTEISFLDITIPARGGKNRGVNQFFRNIPRYSSLPV